MKHVVSLGAVTNMARGRRGTNITEKAKWNRVRYTLIYIFRYLFVKSNRSHVYNEDLNSCYCVKNVSLRICFIYVYLYTCMCTSRIIKYMYLIHLTFTGGGCEDPIIIYYIPFLLYCGCVCGGFFGGGGWRSCTGPSSRLSLFVWNWGLVWNGFLNIQSNILNSGIYGM